MVTHARHYVWHRSLPFIGMHLACVLVFFVDVTPASIALAVGLYALRMFAITAGYHRYFAHRTFKTSRVGQFVLGWLAASSMQKGVLWWAAHHRNHHRLSDILGDPHSPITSTVFYAHIGWVMDSTDATDWGRVKDLSRFPELCWLNSWHLVPAFVLAFLTWWWLGAEGLVVGFVLGTVALWHATFSINSLAHLWGSRRFETSDRSRNNLWLALLTFGEGWHNNHHYYQSSARQGFRWWEVDVTYYALRLLALLGLVWDLREPGTEVLATESLSVHGVNRPSLARARGANRPSVTVSG